MNQEPKKERARNPARRALFGALLGFVLANLFRGGPFALLGFVELFQRLWSWLAGAGGESSQWGEPLYWLCVLGWPGAVAGAAIALIWEILVRARQRRTSNSET
jgi:hypothetical protein